MKGIKLFIAILLIISISLCAIGCTDQSQKSNENNSDNLVAKLVDLTAEQTLVVSNNRFMNTETTTTTESYLTVQKIYGLRLFRSNTQSNYTVNNCSYSSVLNPDDNYYYYWLAYNAYNVTDQVLLGNIETTVKNTYRYVLYGQSSILVETITKTTTKYTYNSEIKKVTSSGAYYLDGYFGFYEVSDLDTVDLLPAGLKKIAHDILNNFTYTVAAPSEKTVTTYNRQTYNDTYFYIENNISNINVLS